VIAGTARHPTTIRNSQFRKPFVRVGDDSSTWIGKRYSVSEDLSRPCSTSSKPIPQVQGTRVRSNFGGQSAFVPTLVNLGGDFTSYLSAGDPNNPLGKVVEIKDPLSGQPFPIT